MNPKYEVHEDRKYLDWVKSLECEVCKTFNLDPHHAWNGRDNDYIAVPLCREHHSECHQIGTKSFEKKHGIAFEFVIIKTLVRYIKYLKKS